MSRRRRIRRTHRKSQPQSPSLPRTWVSGVWHRPLWLAAESEGSARGHKWANKLTIREHTHTHTHTLPLSAPSLRSVYCAQSATGFNNPAPELLSPSTTPPGQRPAGCSPRSPEGRAPRPRLSDLQFACNSNLGPPPLNKRPPSHPWRF